MRGCIVLFVSLLCVIGIQFSDGQCSLGQWGGNCQYNCSTTCFYGNNCTQNGGQCGCKNDTSHCFACIKENYGLTCELLCNKNCSLSDQCIQSGSGCGCDKQFGYCNSCPKTLHGQYCERSCSDKCLNFECSRKSGDCTQGCKRGFHGSDCSTPCPSSCSYGCDQTTAECFPKFCVNCFGGLPNCDRAIQKCTAGCIDGFFGVSCEKTCAEITNISLCTKCATLNNVGITVCSECVPEYFYDGVEGQCFPCSSRCQMDSTTVAKCFPDSGNCRFGCNSGWYGPRCDTFNCSVSGCASCASNQPSVCATCQTGWYLSGGACVKCSDNCQTSNSCDKTTGICTGGCKSGWYGNKCIDSCTNNCLQGKCDMNGVCSSGCNNKRYGQKCDSLCSNCMTSCNRVTGECDTGGCLTGFHGTHCSQACNSNCFNNKCNQTSGKCSSGCKTGFYGEFCQTSCNSDCESKSCDAVTGECYGNCVSGKYGENCDLDCSAHCRPRICVKIGGACTSQCATGYYGSQCSMPCSTGCLNNKCQKADGVCTDGCSAGMYGARCDLSCNSNCNGTKCDRISGSCSDGCKVGYYGDSCKNICSRCDNLGCSRNTGACIGKCISGYYGSKCEQACSMGCLTSHCDKISGKCSSCKEGYQGDNCATRCSDSCKDNACNSTTGLCSKGCVAGKYGTTCNELCSGCTVCNQITGKCEGCPVGKYGPNCDLNCSPNCGLASSGLSFCNGQDGSCLNGCKDGWYGTTCNMPCNNDIHCIGTVCDRQLGYCTGNCVTGWYGESCNLKCSDNCNGRLCHRQTGYCTQNCTLGFYGPQCTTPCTSTCTDCDKNTGACSTCKDGYYGHSCTKQCSSHCFYSSRECNRDTGVCVGGCSDGWYGQTCNNQCPTSCNGRKCDINTGKCKNGCLGDTYGEFCQSLCTNCAGTFSGNCDVMTGICKFGCDDGFYGTSCSQACYHGCKDKKCVKSLYNCTDGCKTGLYGSSCRDSCSTNCLNNVCDRNTGRCTQGCRPGQFGEKCKYACPVSCDVCDQMTGSCGDNCVGSDCEGTTTEDGDGVDMAVIIGAVIAGAVVLLIIIIVVGCHCLRMKARRMNESTDILTPQSSGSIEEKEEICGDCGIDNAHYQNFEEIQKDGWVMRNALVEVKQNGILKTREQAEAPLSMYEIHHQIVESSESESSYDDDIPPPPSVHFCNFDGKNGVQVEMLPQYVDYMMKRKKSFEDEFDDLQEGLIHPYEVAIKPGNKSKNRYKNIYAYDHSRVVLQIDPSETETSQPLVHTSDYINASFIDGYNDPRSYIACQGPTEETINDFWRMVWQYRIQNIVMLTNLVELGESSTTIEQIKCKKYWPEENRTEKYGNLYVKFDYQETFADFTLTNLVVTKENIEEDKHSEDGEDEARLQVKHLQFTSWPDRGVPRYVTPLVEFYCKVKSLHRDGPLLVHCSAGVGRSGTFIGLDYLMDQADSLGFINLYKCVETMRAARPNMVQTPDQYCYLHQALAEALQTSESPVDEDEFENYYNQMLIRDSESGLSKLHTEFDEVQSPRVESRFEAATSDENKHRNRNSTVLASDECRVFLWSRIKGCTDYINAIYLPSYRNKYCFIATEMPQCATIIDFCRMIFQEEVRTVVMLDNETSGINPTEHYWPNPGQTMECGPFSIQIIEEQNTDDFIIRSLNFKFCVDPESKSEMLNVLDQKGTYKVNQFQYKCWSEGKVTPKSVDSFLSFVKAVTEWQSDSIKHPIITHCMDGSTKVGLFCMVRACLDRLQSDGDVSLIHTLHHFRVRRPQLLPNFEQYKFCHDCIFRQLSSN